MKNKSKIIILSTVIILISIVLIIVVFPKENNHIEKPRPTPDTRKEEALSIIIKDSNFKEDDFEYISNDGNEYKFYSKKTSTNYNKEYFVVDIKNKTYVVESKVSIQS